MKKIRIAQIGIGHDHASSVFSVLKKMSDIFEVVGYAEVPEDDFADPWAQARLKGERRFYQNEKQYTVDEILAMPDLDAVAVETYDLNLVKYAQMVADKGLAIHMDKAPGESAEAFEKLLSTVKAKNLPFSIGYMYRANPIIKQTFERVKAGEFGKIHSVDAEMSCFYPKDKRDWLGFFQGGMMQYLGCHLIDLVVRLLGVPQSITPFVCSTGYQGTKAKDFSLAVLQYPNGASTVKSVMGDYGGYVRRHFLINGEKSTIDIRPLEKCEPNGGLHGISSHSVEYTNEDWNVLGEEAHTGAFSRYEGMMSDFAAMVRGERGYIVPLEEEARVHRCLLAACGMNCDFKAEIKL